MPPDAPKKEKRVTQPVRLKESTAKRLADEAEERDISTGLIVEKALSALFDKWDHALSIGDVE